VDIVRNLEGMRLPLSDAVDQAVHNATSVRQAEAGFLAVEGSLRRERGFFDPAVFLAMNHLDDEAPTASFFAGAPVLTTEQTTGIAGLTLSLPIGTELSASMNATRLESNSGFAFLNPQFTSFGLLTLRQPLLSGFDVSARKFLTKAEADYEAGKARYDQEVITASAEVERRYWDLYAAERNYAVQKLTRDRGASFLQETKLRAASGVDGPNAVATARTFLAEQELLLIEREELIDFLSDELSRILGTRPANDEGRFVTSDEPLTVYPLEPVDSLIQWGMDANLDLFAAEQDVEGLRALASAAGWEALPQVNLIGTLGGNGLTGTPQDVIFGEDTLRATRSGDLSDALSQSGKGEFPSWSVGIEVSIPIGLRSGLGEQDRLEAEVMGAEQRRLEVERSLEQLIRSSYRELLHGNSRIEFAREGVDAASEQVRIGVIEYRNGRTTAFELVRLGADFAVAQERYSRALVRTARAAATLTQLTSGKYSASRLESE